MPGGLLQQRSCAAGTDAFRAHGACCFAVETCYPVRSFSRGFPRPRGAVVAQCVCIPFSHFGYLHETRVRDLSTKGPMAVIFTPQCLCSSNIVLTKGAILGQQNTGNFYQGPKGSSSFKQERCTIPLDFTLSFVPICLAWVCFTGA